MAENVVSLKAIRTLKECQKLFEGYRLRIHKMEKTDLLVELDRYRTESSRYPHHLLTIVKGEILLQAVKDRSLTKELKDFALAEEKRLKIELYKRLHEEWTGEKASKH